MSLYLFVADFGANKFTKKNSNNIHLKTHFLTAPTLFSRRAKTPHWRIATQTDLPLNFCSTTGVYLGHGSDSTIIYTHILFCIMKKIIFLGTMAVVAVAVASCSNKDKCDTTCTDAAAGTVVVDETTPSGTAPARVDGAAVEVVTDAQGNIVDAGAVTVEEVAEDGTTLADKAKQGVEEAYDKTKQGVNNAYEKTKDGAKKAYEATKDKTNEIIEKSKEKIHKATE